MRLKITKNTIHTHTQDSITLEQRHIKSNITKYLERLCAIMQRRGRHRRHLLT